MKTTAKDVQKKMKRAEKLLAEIKSDAASFGTLASKQAEEAFNEVQMMRSDFEDNYSHTLTAISFS